MRVVSLLPSATELLIEVGGETGVLDRASELTKVSWLVQHPVLIYVLLS